MERKNLAYAMFMILIIITVGVAGCVTADNQATGGGAQIANPASVYCNEKGGTYKGVTTDAGEAGYCSFPDGRVCEEWAYYRSSGADCVAPAG